VAVLAEADTDVLVVNAGSMSLKLSLVGADELPRRLGSIDEAAGTALVGHRVVHGGDRFTEPTVIDDRVIAELVALEEIAPLHNVLAVDAIRMARASLPDAVHIAVFDTAFHRTLPELAKTYALPERFRERGVHRFGFHGLSIEWASERVRAERLVVCHLGGGSSVTAVRDGESIDTTMGFTPLEGVPMGTRAGSLDPGALIYLLRHGVSVDELDHALEHESGLTGLAGTGDVKTLEADPSASARFALDLYCYRVAQAIGAMVVALGGLDALVFTGGAGEHSAFVRATICGRLGPLGVELDLAANDATAGEAEIGAPSAPVRVHVVPAHEDVVVARACRRAAGSHL
jgi:acetate kinase